MKTLRTMIMVGLTATTFCLEGAKAKAAPKKSQETLLIEAVRAGKKDNVDKALKAGAKVDTLFNGAKKTVKKKEVKEQVTALAEAIRKKNVEIVNLLLNNKANPDQGLQIFATAKDTTLTPSTPLKIAQALNDPKTLEALSTAQANAFIAAVRADNITDAEKALKAGAKVNTLFDKNVPYSSAIEKVTALIEAIRNNNLDMVKLLLNNQADLTTKSLVLYKRDMRKDGVMGFFDVDPISMTMEMINPTTRKELISGSIMQLLVEKAAKEKDYLAQVIGNNTDFDAVALIWINKGIKDSSGAALTAATKANKLDMVKALVDKGASTLASVPTILELAVNTGNLEMVKYFIDKGVKDATGNAIINATQKGLLDFVTTLINSGAKLDAKNSAGNTPLLIAIAAGKSDIAKALLDKKNNPGQFINIQNNEGMTALMLATDKVDLELVKLLLENGADKNLLDKKNRDASGIASSKANSQLTKLLQ